MEIRKVAFGDGSEIELDAAVATKIEATRAANEGQLCGSGQQSHQCRPASDDTPGMPTGCLSVPERMQTMRSSLLPLFSRVTLNS